MASEAVMRRGLASMLIGLGTGMVGGCCHFLPPPKLDNRPLPAPISVEQQLQLLNERASELPRIIATAQVGGVELWNRENGKDVHKSVDGKLILAQRYESHGADVYVRATVFAQDAFEAGKNAREWWFHSAGDHPRGVVGRLDSQAMGSGGGGGEGDGELFRADRIPDMLAITEIVPDTNQRIVMRIDDLRGCNDLLIERLEPDGTESLEREIVVDRRSGEVREVSLYRADGVMLVHAQLNDYHPVSYRGGRGSGGADVSAEGKIPVMPRQIVIDYPLEQVRVGLLLADVQVPATIKESTFSTPDWAELGIKPEVME